MPTSHSIACAVLAAALCGVTVRESPAQVRSDEVLKYHTASPSPLATKVPAELSHQLTRSPAQALPVLVRFLTAGADDPFAKAKVLHDWVALNIAYDVAMWMSGNVADQSAQNVLRSHRAVCEGYASLFGEMCRIAGITCRMIPGYARGAGYDLFARENTGDRNHAWNAVRIAGRWWLIDVTWDAGHVDGGRFMKEYSAQYLFADPSAFIYTHYPADASWQLLDHPVSREEFADLPDLSGEFFLWCGVPSGDWKNRIKSDGRVELSCLVKPHAVLTADVAEVSRRPLSSNRYEVVARRLPGRAFVQPEGDGSDRIMLTFPHEGEYLVRLYVKRRGDRGDFHSIGSIGVESSAGSGFEFPEQYAGFRENGYRLVRPLETMVRKEVNQEFSFVLPGIEKAVLTCGENQVELKSSSPGVFEGSLEPGGDEDVVLWGSTTKQAMRLQAILRFPAAKN